MYYVIVKKLLQPVKFPLDDITCLLCFEIHRQLAADISLVVDDEDLPDIGYLAAQEADDEHLGTAEGADAAVQMAQRLVAYVFQRE